LSQTYLVLYLPLQTFITHKAKSLFFKQLKYMNQLFLINNIVIMKRKLTFLLLTFLFGLQCIVAQNIRVTGVVVGQEDGEPVIGASIMAKGTTQGTVTNYDGEFTLEVDRNARLIVSYVGMVSQELPVQANMRIALLSDTQALDEVIVVAYGTQKKSSFTGSAAAIGSESFEKRPLTNISSALEGNAPGIQVTSAHGQPGESASIRIRGFGSVNASNDPLYVVDGVVYHGEISDINPADIESMTILKDGNSTALYGSSAGNGVVLISTKKGTVNGSTVNLSISQGWSKKAYNDYSRVNVWDYYPAQWEMLKNSYITTGTGAEEAAAKASANIASTLKYNPFSGISDGEVVGTDGKLNSNATTLKWGDDLDWEDAAYKTGYRQEYNLSYGTKTDHSDTYASIGYLSDDGYMLKTDFERYSARMNYNINPVNWFKGGVNVGVTRSLSNVGNSYEDASSSYNNLARFVRNMAPIYPIHKHDKETGAYLDADGNATTDPSKYVYDYDGGRLSDSGRDGIAETELNIRKRERNSQTARTYITIMPLEGLSIQANYGMENLDEKRKVYENPYVGDGTAGPGRLTMEKRSTLTQTFNQLVTYDKSFGLHSFNVLVGHENQSYKYEYMEGYKLEETINGLYEFTNFNTTSRLTSYTYEYNKEGYLGRINYDYADKYYASASFRRDGSSRFHKDNRWGNFYSVGGSWRISQEDFMASYTWIDNLKLRASYGETGNDGILDSDENPSYYPYQTLYTLGKKNGSEAGAYFSTISNADLKWETQVSYDVALEFGLFGKLSGTIEYFNKSSKDLLFNVAQPTSTGVESINQNIGKMTNKGFEIDLHYNILRSKDWSLSAGANATFLTNKITKLPVSMQSGYVTGSKKWVEGKSMYEFWLRQWYGVDPATGDGLYYLDTDAYNEADGTLNSSVQKTIVEIDGKKLTNSYTYAKYDFSGNSIPNVMGGFNFDVSYKRFSFSAVFSYQLGGKILDSTYASLMSMSSYGQAMSSDALKAWKKEGDITDVPRLDNNSTHATNIGQTYSTRWLVSSDYLNLRSVVLGYDLPKNVLSRVSVKSARVNFSAENLFMLKARQGLNPMANFKGISYNEYLPSRNFTIGLNVSF